MSQPLKQPGPDPLGVLLATTDDREELATLIRSNQMTQPPMNPPRLESKTHADFPPDIQRVVEGIRIHIAGCSEAGVFLGTDAFEQDLRHIHAIEGQIVLDPAKLQEEWRQFEAKLRLYGGDATRLQPADFKFMEEGGQVSHLSVDELRKLCTEKKGYALLAKYAGIPLAYNLGLSELPIDDPDYPNLDARRIAGPKSDVEWIIAHQQKLWANWRTGVLRAFDQPFIDHLAAEGLQLPSELSTDDFTRKGARRMGLSNLIKFSVAHGAKDWKEGIVFNIGRIYRPGYPLDAAISIPNLPSTEAVSEAFAPLAGLVRDAVYKLMKDGSVHIADMRWFMHGNRPDAVIQAMERRGGVLLRQTAGHKLEQPRNTGQTLQKRLRQNEAV